MLNTIGRWVGPGEVYAAVIIGGFAAVILWPREEPRAAVLAESSVPGSRLRRDVVVLMSGDGDESLRVPVGTRCTLVGADTAETVAVEYRGRRWFAHRSQVRADGPR